MSVQTMLRKGGKKQKMPKGRVKVNKETDQERRQGGREGGREEGVRTGREAIALRMTE